MKIDQKSWHYRFAMLFRDGGIDSNLCAYTRAFMLSCVSTLLLSTMAFGILYGVGDMLGWMAAMARRLCWITPEPAAGVGLALLIVITGLLTLLIVLEAETFAPIREAAKARKEMFCPSIEFKG